MKPVAALAVLLLAATATFSQSTVVPETLSALEPRRAGELLAARLRSLAPAEESEFKGVLNIRRGQTRIVPMSLKITIEGPVWKATYETTGTASVPAEKFVVVHCTNGPNEYLYANASKPGEAPGSALRRNGEEAAVPFAGSDFWLMDFGLEFLHWPQQRLLKTEMRKSRVCHVLESIHPKPAPGGYRRVVSWVDKENGGIILAEAFDHQDRRLKEFSIGKVTKVEGVWQLEEMEIRNLQTKSRTRLEFDFEAAK